MEKQIQRCGAMTRKGTPCRNAAMANGRCWLHGGKESISPEATVPGADQAKDRPADPDQIESIPEDAEEALPGSLPELELDVDTIELMEVEPESETVSDTEEIDITEIEAALEAVEDVPESEAPSTEEPALELELEPEPGQDAAGDESEGESDETGEIDLTDLAEMLEEDRTDEGETDADGDNKPPEMAADQDLEVLTEEPQIELEMDDLELLDPDSDPAPKDLQPPEAEGDIFSEELELEMAESPQPDAMDEEIEPEVSADAENSDLADLEMLPDDEPISGTGGQTEAAGSDLELELELEMDSDPVTGKDTVETEPEIEHETEMPDPAEQEDLSEVAEPTSQWLDIETMRAEDKEASGTPEAAETGVEIEDKGAAESPEAGPPADQVKKDMLAEFSDTWDMKPRRAALKAKKAPARSMAIFPHKKAVPFLKKRISIPVPVFLVVLALAIAAAAGGIVRMSGGKAVDPGNLNINAFNVTTQIVDNSEIGPLFVITGKVRNGYDHDRSAIQITGKLFIRGNFSKAETVYCGNILSDEELSDSGRQVINQRLHHKAGDNNANARVSPGGMLPFMIVFSDLPDDLKLLDRYTVEVAGSAVP